MYTVVIANDRASANGVDKPTILVIVGAPGTSEYADAFNAAADQWRDAAKRGDVHFIRIGDAKLDADADKDKPTDRARIADTLANLPKQSPHAVWIVMLGHGTFDGRRAKFNLRGPDVSADDFVDWLRPIERPVALINAASSSAPFLKPLSAPGRVIVTATKSGSEQNYARFGAHLSRAIADPEADLDKDGQTSLLEAFLVASRRVAEFYESEKRLATEHALIDDNADGLGTRAEWYRGVRPVKKAATDAEPDGYRAHLMHLVPSDFERQIPADLRAKRDELELQVVKLRDAQDTLDQDEYLRQIEPLLVELAKVYQQVERSTGQSPNKNQ